MPSRTLNLLTYPPTCCDQPMQVVWSVSLQRKIFICPGCLTRTSGGVRDEDEPTGGNMRGKYDGAIIVLLLLATVAAVGAVINTIVLLSEKLPS